MSASRARALRTRAATAALLVPLAVSAVLWLPERLFALLFGAVACLGAWEWTRLAGWRRPATRLSYVLATALLLALAGEVLALPAARLGLSALALGWWLVALAWVVRYERGGPGGVPRPPVALLVGWLTLVPAWAALVHLHGQGVHGPWLVLFLLGLVSGADIAAYLAGSRWGRRKLAPRVSPGKTLEGLGGALVFALLLGAGLAPLLAGVVGRPAFLLLCLGTVLASVLGDLAESLFKRMAGVKDSGSLLPGHGGVLDRIDSLTAAAPLFALGLTLGGRA